MFASAQNKHKAKSTTAYLFQFCLLCQWSVLSIKFKYFSDSMNRFCYCTWSCNLKVQNILAILKINAVYN